MPYILRFKPLSKRGGPQLIAEAETATEALRQARAFIADDHSVLWISGPDGRRVLLSELEEQAKADRQSPPPGK